MDINMPVMDGKQDIKCVAVTASLLHWERSDILEAGFSDFIAKPFSIELVYHSVSQLLNIEYQPDTTPCPPQHLSPQHLSPQHKSQNQAADIRPVTLTAQLLINYEFDAMLKQISQSAHASS
jgi:DNA-binding response OmpR family regulator